MPVKKVPCVSCGAENHPNCCTCRSSCGNACKRMRGRPRGEVGGGSRGVKPVEVNRSEGETVRPLESRTVSWPTKTNLTKPCPSCGEQNSLLNSLCDHCQQSLVCKRGRPTKTSNEYSTKPCPSCGEQNSLLNSLCDHCQQSLVKPCKSGKPCPICGEINDPKLDTCSHCEQPLKRKRGRHTVCMSQLWYNE